MKADQNQFESENMSEYEKATSAFDSGNFDHAEKAFRAILYTEPNNVDAHIYLAYCLIELNEKKEAEKEAWKAYKIMPSAKSLHSALTFSFRRPRTKNLYYLFSILILIGAITTNSLILSFLISTPLLILPIFSSVLQIRLNKWPIGTAFTLLIVLIGLFVFNWSIPRLDSDDLSLRVNQYEWAVSYTHVTSIRFPPRLYSGRAKNIRIDVNVINHTDKKLRVNCQVIGEKGYMYESSIIEYKIPPGETEIALDYLILDNDNNLSLLCGNHVSRIVVPID